MRPADDPSRAPSARPGARVTVTEVAEAAGLSRAVAARALGGYGSVSAEKRERALGAAARLKYRPNLAARQTRSGRTTTIGVVVSDISNGFFGQMVRRIADRAGAWGYDIVVLNTDESLDAERQAVHLLLAQRAAGIVIASATPVVQDHLVEAQQLGVPLVLIDRRVHGLNTDRVIADNTSSAVEAMDHLVQQGHRRIAYLTTAEPPPGHVAGSELDLNAVTTSAGDRIRAYTEALLAVGSDPWRDLIMSPFGPDAVHDHIADMLRRADRPTALFASDGVIALASVRAIMAAGLRMPTDIAVVSGDQPDWVLATSPQLSAIWQPVSRIGQLAADLVHRRISEPDAEISEIVLPSVFRPRGSSTS